MKSAYLLEIFSAADLTLRGSDEALGYVRSHITQASSVPGGVLKELSTLISPLYPPGLLVFILTNDDITNDLLSHDLSRLNPSAGHDDVMLFLRLADYLRSFLLRVPPDTGRLPRIVTECTEQLTWLESGLTALLNCGLLSGMSSTRQGNDAKSTSKSGKGPRKLKESQIGKSQGSLSSEPFRRLGETPPRKKEDAVLIWGRMVEKLRQTIMRYLDSLKISAIKKHATSAYLASPEAQFANAKRQSRFAEADLTSAEDATRAGRISKENGGGLGDWNVHMSSRALRDLRQYGRGDAKISAIVDKKIEELSHGFFSDSNQTKIAGGNGEIPVYKAYMTGDLRLVYQIDCGPIVMPSGKHSDFDIQGIKILAVCDPKELTRSIWSAIASQSKQRTAEYRKRCTWREVPSIKTKGQNVTPPAVFSRNDEMQDFGQASVGETGLSDEDAMEVHEILGLAKFIVYSPSLLASGSASPEHSYAFSTSSHENEIISHRSSCLIIGRSGTGKTTAMVFRMLDREAEAERQNMPIRQVFVTQSRMLATQVQKRFRHMHNPDAVVGGTHVDGEGPLGLDLEDNEDQDTTIPQRFSDFQDQHFPLFLTFDRLCTLLERDYEPSKGRRYDNIQAFMETGEDSKETISYPIFLSSFWPHFNRRLTGNLDPALVFNEFMGVIMGSETSLGHPKGYLDRQAYEQLSTRTQSTFAESRSEIYSLFESYLKRKWMISGVDAPERTRAILNKIKERPLAARVDFLYVDEVQDNSIVDAQLLRLLCKNPHGQVWGGDTAQTIAVGSSFRFNDLKAFLYRAEASEQMVLQGVRKAVKPAFFQLSLNYRSHNGIIDVAASVIQLLAKLFPNSIDSLVPERGRGHGPKPEFLHGEVSNFTLADFLPGRHDQYPHLKTAVLSESQGGMLGGDQVILVRDESSRETLYTQVGRKPGLVLTLYESKGLEFNDVILYNFFADSTATAKDWRHTIKLFEGWCDDGHRALRGEGRQLVSIQSELKFLYVGLTRARKRVWLWDSSEKGIPMRELWLRMNLVTSRQLSAGSRLPFLPQEQTATDSWRNQWKERALELFNGKQYKHAAFCFKQGQMIPEMELALAFELRRAAFALSKSHSERPAAMVKAAVALEKCAEDSSVPRKEKSLLLRAAEARFEAREYIKAGLLFERARSFQSAAGSYRNASSFNNAVRVVQDHKAEISGAFFESIMDTAKIYYTKNNQISEARKLFGSDDEYLGFLEDMGFDEQRFKFLGKSNRKSKFEEMAAICFHNEENLKGIKCLLRSQRQESLIDARRRLWSCLWGIFALASTAPRDDQQVEELLTLIKSGPLSEQEITHMGLIDQLRFGQKTAVRTIGHRLVKAGDSRAALLAFDTSLRDTRNDWSHRDGPALHQDIFTFTHDVRVYAGLIHQVIGRANSATGREWQSLFGLSSETSSQSGAKVNSKSILVLSNSVVYQDAARSQRAKTADVKQRARRSKTSPNTIRVDRQVVTELLRKALLQRLNFVLWNLHEAAIKCEAFRVCSRFAMFGSAGCTNDMDCSRQHADQDTINVETFNIRVQLHLEIVLTLNHFAVLGTGENPKTMQRAWLEQLFETLCPPVPMLGSLSNLRSDLQPLLAEGMAVICSWVQSRFLTSNWTTEQKSFLSDVLKTSFLAFSLDRANASEYALKGQWREGNPPELMAVVPVVGQVGNHEDPTPIIKNLFRWYFQPAPRRLISGILFLSLAIERGLEIDINILTHLIEVICAHAIVSIKSAVDGSSVPRTTADGVILPRTLLLTALTQSPGAVVLTHLEKLAEVIGVFAKRLVENNDSYTILESPAHGVEGAGFWDRSSTISRLCCCLVLLGHNIRSQRLGDFVLSALSLSGALREDPIDLESLHHTLVQPYVSAARASDWDTLARIVADSKIHLALDELVMVHTGLPSLETPFPGLRLVRFDTTVDLLAKLTEQQPMLMNVGKRRATNAPGTRATAKAWKETDGDIWERYRERSACMRIQRCYRRYRRENNSPSAAPSRFEEFLAVFKTSPGTAKTSRNYRLRLLGPLPHFFAHAEKLMQRAEDQMDAINDHFDTAAPNELEDLREKQKALIRFIRGTRTLLEELGPRSPFHLSRSIGSLQEAVRRFVRTKEASDGVLESIEDDDYRLGVEALLREPRLYSIKLTPGMFDTQNWDQDASWGEDSDEAF